MEYRLSGEKMAQQDQVNTYIAETLGLPQNNCLDFEGIRRQLSQWVQDDVIVIEKVQCMLMGLGEYGTQLLEAMQKGAQESDHLLLAVEP